MDREEIDRLLVNLPEWQLMEDLPTFQIQRIFRFSNFSEPLSFANRVGEIANAENHHPTLIIEWGRLTVRLWTHTAGGLHRNDFIMAARIDRLFSGG